MDKGAIVVLTGAHVVETARALVIRLIELNRTVEALDTSAGITHAVSAAEQLTRDGKIVVVADDRYSKASVSETDTRSIEFEVAPYDTPDFAAEKVLDELVEAGVLTMEDAVYSDEDEERIRKRLADLGYIE